MINSILYAATTSTANLFPDIYPYLGDTTLGLCFLTIGGGMAIGTVLVGRVLDADYARYERKVEKKARLEGREAGEGQFPIEKVRSASCLNHVLALTQNAGSFASGRPNLRYPHNCHRRSGLVLRGAHAYCSAPHLALPQRDDDDCSHEHDADSHRRPYAQAGRVDHSLREYSHQASFHAMTASLIIFSQNNLLRCLIAAGFVSGKRLTSTP